MRDYLLFIDTEASGLPQNWRAPYAQAGNWPYAVQISWIIYTKAGQQVKWENYYISDDDFQITPAALKIHGITHDYLLRHGESRKKILSFLIDDLQKYQPLVVGHFVEFDALVLGADFYRTGLENPLIGLPTFCTMLATANHVPNPWLKYLRLGDLYHLLFNTALEQPHNALVDARATADCFFELVKRGEINADKITQQEITRNQIKDTRKINTANQKLKYVILALMLFLSAILLYYKL